MKGVTMKDEFNPEPQVYLAVTVPKFPNYFVVNGVRGTSGSLPLQHQTPAHTTAGNWAQGSALPSHEVQVDYITKCVKKMQEEQIKALEVKQTAVTQLYQYIEKWHEHSVWAADCKRYLAFPPLAPLLYAINT